MTRAEQRKEERRQRRYHTWILVKAGGLLHEQNYYSSNLRRARAWMCAMIKDFPASESYQILDNWRHVVVWPPQAKAA